MKLANYYEFLQISPNAEPETVHRVYRFLAARLHPDNPETGNPEKFFLLKEAYEVLSDPTRRSDYDANCEREAAESAPLSNSLDFLDSVEGELNRRLAVLALLYLRRRTHPDSPEVSLAEVEKRMGFPREYLQFTIWYLQKKGYITRADNSAFTLTADGVDFVETQRSNAPALHKLLTSGAGVTATSTEAVPEPAPAPSPIIVPIVYEVPPALGAEPIAETHEVPEIHHETPVVLMNIHEVKEQVPEPAAEVHAAEEDTEIPEDEDEEFNEEEDSEDEEEDSEDDEDLDDEEEDLEDDDEEEEEVSEEDEPEVSKEEPLEDDVQVPAAVGEVSEAQVEVPAVSEEVTAQPVAVSVVDDEEPNGGGIGLVGEELNSEASHEFEPVSVSHDEVPIPEEEVLVAVDTSGADAAFESFRLEVQSNAETAPIPRSRHRNFLFRSGLR